MLLLKWCIQKRAMGNKKYGDGISHSMEYPGGKTNSPVLIQSLWLVGVYQSN